MTSRGTKQPIRDLATIEKMKRWLLVNKTYRDYFLLFFMMNTGLRVSDTLALRVMDVRNKDGLHWRVKKNNKSIVIPFNSDVQREIRKYTEDKSETEFLFSSRKGENQAISQQQADRVLKEAAAACGVMNFSTHVCRKSFGYHYYQKNLDVYYLMKLFGHMTQRQTLDYIGVTTDEIRASMEGLTL